MKKQINKLFTLFTVLLFGFGQMWAGDPVETVGDYSTRVISADGTSSTWTFILPSSQTNAEDGKIDNGILYHPSSSGKMKFTSSNQFSWQGQSSGYIPVPSGSAGTISMTVKSSSDSRYLQLYVGGSAAADSKRLWSKYNATPTSDGKKGPQSFSFTADDITTEGGKTYLHFKDNNTEMKITSFTVTLTTGNYLSSGPVDPTASFSNGNYTIGGSDLDLSSLFTTNSDGAVTYTITAQGTTDAALRADGKSFYATTAGTATVKVEQASTSSYNAYDATASITVSDFVAITSIALDYDEQHITVGDVITITPTILPANASNKTLTWSVTSGASITQAGVLTAEAAGDVTVTATAQDGSSISATSHIYIDALVPCATLTPATSGTAPAAGDAIDLQEVSPNASMKALTTNLSYTANGLLFGSSSSTKVEVTLNNLMQVGTVIRATVYNDNNDKARGLNLLNSAGTSKATWTKTLTGDHVETYTVVAGDGLAGSNVFQLQRNQNAYLKDISVSNCGAELLDLSAAVDPVGKATITLSKNLVEAGGTATATYSAIDAAYDFDEWQISGATIDDASANPVTITMGSTAATITLKLKAASVKYAVHFDSKGGSAVADQLVEAGGHASVPTAPTKFKYTFGGWSETDGGSTPADLGSIAINAEKTFYAIWTDKVCPTSGTIFSVSQNGSQPASEVKWTNAENDGARDVSDYFNVVNGIAALVNNSSSNNQVSITTDPKMKFSSDANGWAHLRLECALAEGDVITLDNTNKCIVSYTADKAEGTTYTLPNSTSHTITVPASWAGEDELYIFRNGSNFYISSINIVRPAKYAVTFNMHGHGDAVAEQSVVEGGKVTEPSDPTASGWDFGGWFTDDTYGTTWDFENMTISAATEIHALWTVHTTSSDATLKDLTVGGVTVAGFDPATEEYNVVLEMGTTTAPTVSGTANDDNVKSVVIMQTSDPTDDATITVTAEDNTTKVYTVHFSVATSKDIQLVFKTGTTPCVGSASTATQILSNNAAVSTYINQITFTNVEGAGDDGAEGSSLNVGKKVGNMFTLSAKAGYAFQAMNFLAKIQDATCEYSIDGGAWTELASTNTGADECYAPFASGTVHEFRLRSTGTSGVWIRNMQLTLIEACAPVVVTWDEEPVEFEVGKAGYAVAATANSGGTITYGTSDNAVVDVNASTGALTIAGLGSAALSASAPEGDGTTYCENGGAAIVISKAVNTYYLVQFDPQNEEAVIPVKYYDGDPAIALPAVSYIGHTFQGWFDASTGGNQITEAVTPSASRTIYAQWTADCDGPTINVQPANANYLTGRAATILSCEATAGNGGALTYTWYSCDDDARTNPVELTGAPTPSTAAAGTFYYYCAVTEEGCAVIANSDVATIVVTDKDPICLVWADVTGNGTFVVDEAKSLFAATAQVNGNVKSSSTYGGKTGYKFNSAPAFLGFEDVALKSGDRVEVFVTALNGLADKLRAFNANEAIDANKIAESAANIELGANSAMLNADASALYLRRGDDYTGWNPSVAYIAVYRACAPILNKVTVAGVEAAPNALKEVVFEVAASTTQSQLEAIAFDWVSNDDAWTADHAPVAANAWEFGVANTVTFTDKDGDQSVYTITVNKAAASSDATLSELTVNGQAIALVPDQYTYAYEFEYGTAETPAPVVAAVANDANRKLLEITQASTTSGTATVEIVAEDESTTLTYTIKFSVCRTQKFKIYDGSTMNGIENSGSDATGFVWSLVEPSKTEGTSVTLSYGGKNYTHCVNVFTSATDPAQNKRYMSITIPAGYMAKFYLVGGSNGSSERSLFISKEITSTVDNSIAYATSAGTSNADGRVSDYQFPGTYYLCATASIRLYELSVQLYPIDYSRDVTEGRFGTICLPNGGVMVGAAIFEIAYMDYQNNKPYKIFFDEVLNGEMVAGRPYIFLPNAGATQLGVSYTDAANATAGNFNGLYGSYSRINLTADAGNYILKDNRYYYVNTDNVYCGANRAYIKLAEVPDYDPGQPAYGRRRVSMGFEGAEVATGIEMTNDQSPITNKVLINGELFILRGDKMYDATGRLVK